MTCVCGWFSAWHLHGKQYAHVRLYYLLCVIPLYGCVYTNLNCVSIGSGILWYISNNPSNDILSENVQI